ncbi:MAG: prepilin peptidase [Bacillota bacterium]|nr:prepilin peptidase [Bacillota bacterium]
MTIFYYSIVFAYGLLIGSFLNVCICRIPLEESVVKPPSHCPNCGTRLTAVDLVPVFSYLFLRGKCRHCKAKISLKYPMLELLTALIYLPLFYKYGQNGHYIEFFAAAYLMSILIVVFFIDLKHQIIPDGLVILGLAGGIALTVYNLFRPVAIFHDRAWWNPIVGMLAGSGFLFLVAIIGLLIYKEEAMGFGDVKLLAAIGGYLGWKMTLTALLTSIILSALVSVILMALKIRDRKDHIPLGPFIVTGTYITLLFGWDILKILYPSFV